MLGVDIGGVIINRVNNGADTSFLSNNYLHTPPIREVFTALHQLVQKRFGDRVFLVSKCGQRVQDKTLHWLDLHSFYYHTAIGRDRVRFCRERYEKAGVCKELGITHFVDDRLEVLGNLTMVGTLYLFQPRPNEVLRFARFLKRVRRVNSWQEILTELLP